MSDDAAQRAAIVAAEVARQLTPKSSGISAAGIYPLHGHGFFGIGWKSEHLWYQEAGTRAHTMRSLAGRTIPMWVSDLNGQLRADNPSIKTRTTATGELQVLIFRRAAKIGQRKTMVRNGLKVDVPASYPGAPGRISRRHGVPPQQGKIPGQIAQGNVGVRWRHPGLSPRGFLRRGVEVAAGQLGIPSRDIVATDQEWS